MKEIQIHSEIIKLSQFLKWAGAVENGAEANEIIRQGQVKVNGEVRTERGKKLSKGDTVEVEGAGSFIII